jgi:hypothetical protein
MNHYLDPLKDCFGIVQEGFTEEFYVGYISRSRFAWAAHGIA